MQIINFFLRNKKPGPQNTGRNNLFLSIEKIIRSEKFIVFFLNEKIINSIFFINQPNRKKFYYLQQKKKIEKKVLLKWRWVCVCLLRLSIDCSLIIRLLPLSARSD